VHVHHELLAGLQSVRALLRLIPLSPKLVASSVRAEELLSQRVAVSHGAFGSGTNLIRSPFGHRRSLCQRKDRRFQRRQGARHERLMTGVVTGVVTQAIVRWRDTGQMLSGHENPRLSVVSHLAAPSLAADEPHGGLSADAALAGQLAVAEPPAVIGQ